MIFCNLQSTFTYDILFHCIVQTTRGSTEADNLILTDEETEVRRDFSLLVILVS